MLALVDPGTFVGIAMAIWRAIKNLFIPWNLITPSAPPEHEGVRTVDYGQMLIDGTSGDVSDITRILTHPEPPPPNHDT